MSNDTLYASASVYVTEKDSLYLATDEDNLVSRDSFHIVRDNELSLLI